MSDDVLGLDPELLEQQSDQIADMLRGQNWTGLQTVTLGALIGTERRVRVPDGDRQYQNQVYFTSLDGLQVGKVINTAADMRYGRRVVVGYPPNDKSRLYVMRTDVSNESEPSSPDFGVLPHAGQHELHNLGYTGEQFSGKVGEDPPRIDLRQLYNAQVMPWSGMIAYLAPGWIPTLYGRKFWPGGELADLTAQIPSGVGYSKFCLVEIDYSLAVSYTYSAEFPTRDELREHVLWDYVPPGDKSKFGPTVIGLTNGMTRITWAHLWSGRLVHSPTVAQVLGQVPTHNGRVTVYDGKVVYT